MSSFIVNKATIEALAIDPEVVEECYIVAQEIAKAAQIIARAEAFDTGAYHDSIKAYAFTDTGRVQVRANDPKSNWIEHGTMNHQGDSSGYPARHVLVRACEMVTGVTPSGGEKT